MSDPTLLDAILAPGGLSVLFQPIYEIHGQTLTLHALEALTRGPAGTNVHRADVLFEYARRTERIAVSPVGYADGFRRAPQTWGSVLINGQHAPIVGRVSMDMTMIDV